MSGFQGIVQTSGFLVPGKKSGQLEVYNEENYQGPWNVASKSNIDWSYHWLIWHDVDDDGLLDIMTARYIIVYFIKSASPVLPDDEAYFMSCDLQSPHSLFQSL